jgi:hypothetical protein
LGPQSLWHSVVIYAVGPSLTRLVNSDHSLLLVLALVMQSVCPDIHYFLSDLRACWWEYNLWPLYHHRINPWQAIQLEVNPCLSLSRSISSSVFCCCLSAKVQQHHFYCLPLLSIVVTWCKGKSGQLFNVWYVDIFSKNCFAFSGQCLVSSFHQKYPTFLLGRWQLHCKHGSNLAACIQLFSIIY